MSIRLSMQDVQKRLIDEIFTADNIIKTTRAKLEELRNTLNDSWTTEQRTAIIKNPDEMIELDGFHHAVAMSPEEKNRTANLECVVTSLTKEQLSSVILVHLQKLEQEHPAVYEKAIKKEPTGSRKIYMLKDKNDDFGYRDSSDRSEGPKAKLGRENKKVGRRGTKAARGTKRPSGRNQRS